MSKFEVGDEVKTIKIRGGFETYGKYLNQIGSVTLVQNEFTNYETNYKLSIDDGMYNWFDEELELVSYGLEMYVKEKNKIKKKISELESEKECLIEEHNDIENIINRKSWQVICNPI